MADVRNQSKTRSTVGGYCTTKSAIKKPLFCRLARTRFFSLSPRDLQNFPQRFFNRVPSWGRWGVFGAGVCANEGPMYFGRGSGASQGAGGRVGCHGSDWRLGSLDAITRHAKHLMAR